MLSLLFSPLIKYLFPMIHLQVCCWFLLLHLIRCWKPPVYFFISVIIHIGYLISTLKPFESLTWFMHFLFNSLSIFMTAILNSLSGKFISPFHWGQFLESYLIPSGLISLFLIFFPCFLIFLDFQCWFYALEKKKATTATFPSLKILNHIRDPTYDSTLH